MGKKRMLTADETSEVLSLKKDDIDMNLLRSYFAVKKGKDAARFNTFDTLKLPKGHLHNKEAVETTVGRYLINFYVIPEKFLKKYGYQNVTFTKKVAGDMESKLSTMLLNDEITIENFIEYINNGEWITLGTAYFLVPTMDYAMTVPLPEVIKRRDELFTQYEEGVKAGDPNVADAIEKELITLSKKLLKEKGNEGYDFFESEEFNFGNNYKKSSIMGGALENPYTKKLNILKSNYVEGIKKEEFPYFANITVVGGYSRNVETQKGGYETKKINNSMQVIVLDEPKTDCGTTQYLDIVIPDKMKNMFLNRYILTSAGKLIELTEENIGSYVGKSVSMRSPMFCKTEKICNMCAGELFYKMNVRNAGLLTSTLSGSLMNLAMKKFHDTSIKFSKIDLDKYIQER
jgi:hypothetical protein